MEVIPWASRKGGYTISLSNDDQARLLDWLQAYTVNISLHTDDGQEVEFRKEV